LNRAWQRTIFAAAIAVALMGSAAPRALASLALSPQAAVPSSAGRIVTDEVGREVKVPATVNRIVTLAPNLTETIYALGLEDRLAGDTDYCDTPPAAKAKPHVGSPVSPSLEAIVALRPDLVLATTSINRLGTVDALARLGIAVYTSDPHTVRGMLNSIASMADLMGQGPAGAALAAQLQARLDALRARLADRPIVHVLFVVWEDPLITIGQNTFIADALRWAGAESVILSSQNYPRISLEEVVRLEPDYIVLTSDHEAAEGSDAAALRAREGWKQLQAVQEDHVAVVGDGIDRPSPGLVAAIEELAHLLHPEVFGAISSTMNNSTMECTCAR
jgi:iron complex transport system substrate-binding protein